MNRLVLALLSALALAGCSSNAPYATSVGVLRPGATLTVIASHANVNVFKPAVGEANDRYTIASNALPKTTPAAPTIRTAGNGVIVTARDPLFGLLVRLPDRVNLVVDSKEGNVNVTDVTGNIDVSAGTGNVTIMVPGVAQASTLDGNIAVTLGATQWVGTLKFTTGKGDINVYVPEIAKFHVRMHTDDGTLFTDFGLRGTSTGSNETIEADVNGGSPYAIDIEAHRGTVRLLRLTPQA